MIKYFRELLDTLRRIDDRLKKLDDLYKLDKLSSIDARIAQVTASCSSGAFIKTGGKHD